MHFFSKYILLSTVHVSASDSVAKTATNFGHHGFKPSFQEATRLDTFGFLIFDDFRQQKYKNIHNLTNYLASYIATTITKPASHV